jgi:hypothetical protein
MTVSKYRQNAKMPKWKCHSVYDLKRHECQTSKQYRYLFSYIRELVHYEFVYLSAQPLRSEPFMAKHFSINNNSLGRQVYLTWFEVLRALVMKNCFFWDKMPYSPLNVNRCSRGTRRFHFQGQRISQVRNWSGASRKLKMEATFPYEMLIEFQRTTLLFKNIVRHV